MFVKTKQNKTIQLGSNTQIQHSFNDEKNFIQVNIGHKVARFIKKKLRRKAFFNDLKSRLQNQIKQSITAQKDNKKYIPNIYFELNDVKENLRYVVDPILFFQKTITKIKLIEFTFFNRIFERLNFKPVRIDIGTHFEDQLQLNELDLRIDELRTILNKTKSELPDFSNREKIEPQLDDEQIKVYIKDEITPKRIEWILRDFFKDLDTISKRVVLLTERAGQGKTNLVCDFAENFILKKNLYGVFLTGNKFHSLTNENIENIILKNIFGFDFDFNFKEFLDDMEELCRESNSTFTIIIDGINENSGILNFSKELCDFIEKIIRYDFVRVVLTCRSEYFNERFKEFISPPFKKNLLLSQNYLNRFRSQERLPDYIEQRLIKTYFDYFQVINFVHENIKRRLANDFLLLRIFSEFYGKKTNPNAPTEQVFDIYKDDLFSSYFKYKSDLIDKHSNYSLTEYKDLFKIIFKYMLKNKIFINISVEKLQGINNELLSAIVDEDIFFRRDLVETEDSLFGKIEVINFTFDEFRDHLFSDYLANSEHDIEGFINEITPNNVALEGIEKYLFFKSRKQKYKEKLAFIENFKHYDSIFINNIFSVNDNDISAEDINRIKYLFNLKSDYAKTIIICLMCRHRTKLYKTLNIFVLFEIISSLDDTQYKETVNPVFQIQKKYNYRDNQTGFILDILEQAEEIFQTYDFDNSYEFFNFFEFLILLLGVNSNGYGGTSHSMLNLLQDYIEKYPKIAKKQLLKYYKIPLVKISIQIWKLLAHCLNVNINFEKYFYIDALESFKANSDNKNLEFAISNFLLKALDKSPHVFNASQQAEIKSLQKISISIKLPFEE